MHREGPSKRVVAAFVVAVAAVLSACTGPSDAPDKQEQAARWADAYLQAVSGAAEDRGWSLLHPGSQQQWKDEAAYVAAAESADWSEFTFEVLDTLYCDDGVMCQVLVDVPGGLDAAPNFLRIPEKDGAVGLRFDEEETIPGNARMAVWLPDLLRGPGGVMLGDG